MSNLCAVDVSPVLRLYYCQHSVPSCEDYAKSFIVFAQCTASTVCCEGAMITPLVIFILLFFIIFTNSYLLGVDEYGVLNPNCL